MTVEQTQRRHLQEALVNTIGAEPTDTLMNYLPPVGWADIATKTDLNHLTEILTSQINSLRTETSAKIAETNAKIAETNARIEITENRILARLDEKLQTQYHRLIVVMITLMTAIMSILLGAFTVINKLT